MDKYTFVWYPFMPIACEGDDDDNTMRVIAVHLKCPSRIDKAIAALQLRMGGYIQHWS